MRSIVIAAAIAASTLPATAEGAREGDRVAVTAEWTVGCAKASDFRELYRIAKEGGNPMAFAISHCQKVFNVRGVPFYIMYTDDDHGPSKGPSMCIRQKDWRDCFWVAKDHLVNVANP